MRATPRKAQSAKQWGPGSESEAAGGLWGCLGEASAVDSLRGPSSRRWAGVGFRRAEAQALPAGMRVRSEYRQGGGFTGDLGAAEATALVQPSWRAQAGEGGVGLWAHLGPQLTRGRPEFSVALVCGPWGMAGAMGRTEASLVVWLFPLPQLG